MNSKQASLSQIQWRQFLGKKAITLSGTESREMVEIKNAICNILQENEAMKNNMDELKETTQRQNIEIANVWASLNKAIKQFDDAEQDLAGTKKIVDQQKEETAKLYFLQDHLEQYM